METILTAFEALEFLKKKEFPVLESKIAKKEEEALFYAKEIGFPVTLKISSKKVIHKSGIRGVRTFIVDAEGVRRAFRDLLDSFYSIFREDDLEGIIVQKMGFGFEMIVGVYEDINFGPVIMVGQGGIYVEDVGDVTFRLLPITERDATSMFEDISVSKVVRSKRIADFDVLKFLQFVKKVSDLATQRPEIKEMDLNPVFVSKEVMICDARIRLLGARSV